jgi:hypothetical protein
VCRAAEILRPGSRFVDGLLPLACGQSVHNYNMRTPGGWRAGTPKQNGPSWAEQSWGHLGGTPRVMVRDVRVNPITSGSQPLFSFAHSTGFKSRVSRRMPE